MQQFLQTHSVEVWGAFTFICLYIAVASIQNAIRDGTEKIVNAITSLEFALQRTENDDHPMYRTPKDF
jgi:hypothetical protein